MSSSLTLIASSIPISQGAEAKVYKAYLTPSPSPTPDSSTDTPTPTPTPTPILLKHRFQKQYRHPHLDASLTRSRVAGEARALLKCLRSGVNVPGIRMVDASEGVLGIEWIEGQSVRMLLPGVDDEEGEGEGVDVDKEGEEEDRLKPYGISLDTLMRLIGEEIAKMHMADIIHGDLTTSNMMLRLPSSHSLSSSSSTPVALGSSPTNTTGTQTETQTQLVRTTTYPIPSHYHLSLHPHHPTLTLLPLVLVLVLTQVLIDFGLSYHSPLVEDKAVDLYVLERAFSSTHPEPSTRPESSTHPKRTVSSTHPERTVSSTHPERTVSSTHPESEGLFEGVLRGYAGRCGRKVWEGVRGRLEDVRLRGRKRSMVG